MRSRAKDQLDVANQAFDNKNYKIALRAARRTVSMWPLSDYAPEAQFLIGKCYEAKGNDEKAFKEYQKLLEKYPKFTKREDVMNTNMKSPTVIWEENGSEYSV
jgi:TolA-binding protein